MHSQTRLRGRVVAEGKHKSPLEPIPLEETVVQVGQENRKPQLISLLYTSHEMYRHTQLHDKALLKPSILVFTRLSERFLPLWKQNVHQHINKGPPVTFLQ
jgi:hypothetical protein